MGQNQAALYLSRHDRLCLESHLINMDKLMGTAFIAVLTSKLPWKTCPRMALGGCVLARDSPRSQSWPDLQLKSCRFQSVFRNTLKSCRLGQRLQVKLNYEAGSVLEMIGYSAGWQLPQWTSVLLGLQQVTVTNYLLEVVFLELQNWISFLRLFTCLCF